MIQENKKTNELHSTTVDYSKQVWTIHEVCSYTNLSRSSIYNFTCKGLIPFYKKAKHLFFDREEINQWLKSNKGYSVELSKERAVSRTLKGGANQHV